MLSLLVANTSVLNLFYLSNCKVNTQEKYINKMNMSKENDGKINQLCNINW